MSLEYLTGIFISLKILLSLNGLQMRKINYKRMDSDQDTFFFETQTKTI